jgi:hypothetical protein
MRKVEPAVAPGLTRVLCCSRALPRVWWGPRPSLLGVKPLWARRGNNSMNQVQSFYFYFSRGALTVCCALR